MTDDVKHSLIWSIALTITVSSVVWSISYYWTTINKAAIESGYSKQSLPGEHGTHWVKNED